tara:strand:+ start:653 stop:1297 length:645 start_codon:yes stop_codon:yes gene_type:complete
MDNTNWNPGIQAMFPLPVFIDKASGTEFEDIDNELTDLVKKIEFSQRPGWNSDTHMLSPDPFNKNILTEYDCKNFLQYLEKSIHRYVSPILRIKFEYCLNASWLTKTIKGKYAQEHHHGTADISGVYYVDTNGNDGALRFDNIHSHACANPLIALLPGQTHMPLETGIIMLWPGYLKHGTAPNPTDHERISLSFNIVLGRPSEYDNDIIQRIRL